MPYYARIREPRVLDRLLTLKAALNKAVPTRTLSGTLLLATWNIREFGKSKMGVRGDEPLHYIAEIIDRFDLVAIQEVREDLRLLDKLKDLLGGWWKYLVTDVTQGTAGGNERMAFLYDGRKIAFGGLVGEVVLPPGKDGPSVQLARTPFLVGFKAGWYSFVLCTTHIYYGKNVAVEPQRLREIQQLAAFLRDRAREDAAWSRNLILLGDFNIFRPEDVTFQAITNAGFVVPQKLQKLPNNFGQDRHYDQIAFLSPEIASDLELCEAGVFNAFKFVYRDEDEALYAEAMGEKYAQKPSGAEKTKYYRLWRTFQLSDHLPMWIELKIDFSERYLRRKLDATRPPTPQAPT